MQLIKLNATPSTNSFIKGLLEEKQLEDFTVVIAQAQTNGRGQRENLWISEEGKNLTFSILKYFESLKIEEHFYLNCLVSLAIYDVLNRLSLPDVKVKWPNDIMSGDKKVCGILVENTISGDMIKRSILGIGLNVNQTEFPNLTNATSLKLKLGKNIDLEELFGVVLNAIKSRLLKFNTNNYSSLKKEYESVLFRKDQHSVFRLPNNNEFNGYIRGVSYSGTLRVECSNGTLEDYNLKEVKQVY